MRLPRLQSFLSTIIFACHLFLSPFFSPVPSLAVPQTRGNIVLVGSSPPRCRHAGVYGHTNMAMHDIEYLPSLPTTSLDVTTPENKSIH